MSGGGVSQVIQSGCVDHQWPPVIHSAPALCTHCVSGAVVGTGAVVGNTSTVWTQVAQWLRICLPVQDTWVRSLGQEGPLEGGMATHSSILAWRTPWTGKPGGLQSIGSHRVGND